MSSINKSLGKSSSHIMGKNVFENFYVQLDERRVFQLVENQPLVGTLHDTFTPKNFQDIDEMITFFSETDDIRNHTVQKEDLSPEAYRTQMVANICLACELAKRYMQSKEYFMGKTLEKAEFRTEKDIINFYKNRYKISETNLNEKMYFCTFLKCVISFMTIIQYKGFKIDYTNRTIDLRNKDFINEIIELFSDEHYFKYGQNDIKFSKDSASMRWQVESDGIRFSVSGTFDVKSLWSIVEKMNGQEKYQSVDAMKDLHRMRIEVNNPRDALLLGRILYKKLGGNLIVENIGDFIDTETLSNFINEHLQDDFPERAEYKGALQNMKGSKVKATSSNTRKEFKFSRSNQGGQKGIEIQIVPVENNNNAHFSHHDIYRIKRQIIEKIRLQGYIRANGMKNLIARIYEENALKNNGKHNIPVGQDEVFEHAMKQLELIEIVGADYKNKSKNRDNIAYSNKETLQKYVDNYKNSSQTIFSPVETVGQRVHVSIYDIFASDSHKK